MAHVPRRSVERGGLPTSLERAMEETDLTRGLYTGNTRHNRILECALFAKANMIVTGDYHLLALERYEAISVVKLSEFLDLVQEG